MLSTCDEGTTGSKVIQSQGVEYILELQKSTSADTFFFDPQKDGSNWLKLEKHRKTICKTQRQHTLSDRWKLLGIHKLPVKHFKKQ